MRSEYLEFEQTVYQALRQCLSGDEEIQAAEILSVNRGNRRFYADFYLPYGCKKLEFPEAFIVELKYNLRYDSFRVLRELQDATKLPILVITSGDNYKEKIVWPDVANRDIRILTIEQLFRKFNINNELYVHPKPSSTKNILAELRAVFKNGNVTLFLGAGVSASAGLPAWDDLMKGFLELVHSRKFEKDDYAALSASAGNSPIITARYLTTIAYSCKKDKAKQAKILRNALYATGTKYTSDLLEAIAETCSVKDPDGIRCVTNVITLNYDDLVEQHLNDRSIPYVSLSGSGSFTSEQLPVIHAHGILPQNNTSAYEMPVLAEPEYHELYQQAYNWSNIDILNALMRSTCVFIGLSMLDPNLRRLLEFAHSQTDKTPRHYAILPNISFSRYNSIAIDPDSIHTPSPEAETEFSHLQNDIFADLGIKVLWYEDGKYEQVPQYLRTVIS
jgi:hypothetical protein